MYGNDYDHMHAYNVELNDTDNIKSVKLFESVLWHNYGIVITGKQVFTLHYYVYAFEWPVIPLLIVAS